MSVYVSGLLEALLDIYGCGQPEGHIMCLLILRNLTFHAPSKPLLTNNSESVLPAAVSELASYLVSLKLSLCVETILEILMAGLESGNLLTVTLSISALWSLLHNHSKVR